MPEPHSPERGWSELVAEAAAAQDWVDAGRDAGTCADRDRIPELAVALAEERPLGPEELSELVSLRADPECDALLAETVSLLQSLPTELDTLEAPAAEGPASDSQVQDDEDLMTLNGFPQMEVSPLRLGHSTPVLVATALCAAAASIALFAWLTPTPESSVGDVPAAVAQAGQTQTIVVPIPSPVLAPAPESESDGFEAVSGHDRPDGVANRSELRKADPNARSGLTADSAGSHGGSSAVQRASVSEGETSDAFADELLKEARAHQFKDPRRAHHLASVAYRLSGSTTAATVMAFAACRSRDVEKAKQAISLLEGETRQTMVESCRRSGVEIPK